jgi:hypothetical protein
MLSRRAFEDLTVHYYRASASPNKRLEEWAIGLNPNEHVVFDVHLLEEVHSEKMSMNQAKLNVGCLIGELAHVCNSVLPELPNKIKMFVELKFNEARPADYCPSGFQNYEADSTRLAQLDDWKCKSISAVEMKAPEHDAELQLTYMVPRHKHTADIVPSNISYTDVSVNMVPPVRRPDPSQKLLGEAQKILNVETLPSQSERLVFSTGTTPQASPHLR